MSKIRCGHCGQFVDIIPLHDQFCPFCGHKIGIAVINTICGGRPVCPSGDQVHNIFIQPGYKFCPGCGKELVITETGETRQRQAAVA